MLARGGGAVGLGLIATPLAALVPLIAPGNDGEQKTCTPLVTELKKGGTQPSRAALPAKRATTGKDDKRPKAGDS